MEIKCSKCSGNIEFQITSLDSIPKIRCVSCSSCFTVAVSFELIPVLENKNEHVSEDSGINNPSDTWKNKKVLIDIAGFASREVLKELLQKEGFKPSVFDETKDLTDFVKDLRPEVIIIDVDRLFKGTENIIENLKAEYKEDIKVILLASIYKKDRYRREPENLYGADAFIERHAITTELSLVLENLILHKKDAPKKSILDITSPGSGAEKGLSDLMAGNMYKPKEEIKEIKIEVQEKISPETNRIEELDEDEDVLQMPSPKTITPAVDAAQQNAAPEIESAKRLARIIVSDIALYNQKAIEDGIKNGTFFELLKEDIDEGRRLYNSRVSKDIQQGENYYKSALLDFVKKKKAQLTKSA